MNWIYDLLLIIAVLGIIIEFKYSPRLDYTQEGNCLLHYNRKDCFGRITRDYVKIY